MKKTMMMLETCLRRRARWDREMSQVVTNSLPVSSASASNAGRREGKGREEEEERKEVGKRKEGGRRGEEGGR